MGVGFGWQGALVGAVVLSACSVDTSVTPLGGPGRDAAVQRDSAPGVDAPVIVDCDSPGPDLCNRADDDCDPSTLDEVLQDQLRRDRDDSERAVAPLRPAPDAVVVDTSGVPLDAVVDRLVREVRERLGARAR